MGAQRYEDLEIWQMARQLTFEVYSVTSDGSIRRDYAVADQMRRASLSIMCNVAEGFGREGPRQFGHFLDMARSSCLEVQSLLYAAKDQRYLNAEIFDRLYEMCSKLYAKICALMRYLKRKLSGGS